jgi:xanthine dehydrogenase small subunit
MADRLRFVLNDQPVEIADVSPMTTLLDWLRDRRGLKGTKEGCAEGDCGACTVVLERADGTREPMNACIAMLGQIDGQAVRTVEGLRGKDSAHPVQQAMAESDATQCGFCTPGFVMSAYAFAAGGEAAEPETIHDALAGNLCRCTGYRPIVAAMTKIAGLAIEPPAVPTSRTTSVAFFGSIDEPLLIAVSATDEVSIGGARVKPEDVNARLKQALSHVQEATFFAPRSLAELVELRARHPDALLLAGGTDLGLLASRSRKPPAAAIHVAHVPELNVLREDKERVIVGAAVPYARAMSLLIENYPALKNYLARLGSRQIRSMGTIGGNLGTASPIGDMPPVLLALEATLKLASGRGTREVAIDDFFLGYRKTALAADEVIESISMPKLWPHEVFFCDKVSKRRDQDISTVAAAYRLRLKDGKVENVRTGFGGMAATPKRAAQAEALLLKNDFEGAAAAIARDFQPIDDWRGTAAYRLTVAANLMRRLKLRIERPGQPVEVEAL